MTSFKTKKGTELPILNLRGKDYLEVKYRIFWMREEHPDWGIETSVQISPDGKKTLSEAIIKDVSGRTLAMGHKVEDVAGFQDHTEKSETGAIGRALALCGYGTQFTGDELDEGPRLADAPIERRTPHSQTEQLPISGSSLAKTNPGMVLVPYGSKYKDKPISQVPIEALEADWAYWESRAKKEGKPLAGKTAEYVQAIKDYLASKPPISYPDQGPLPSIDDDIPF